MLPPMRSTLTSVETAVKRSSVPALGTFVRSTIRSAVKTRFFATSETGFMPPPARAINRLESFAAAAKTPRSTSSRGSQRRFLMRISMRWVPVGRCSGIGLLGVVWGWLLWAP